MTDATPVAYHAWHLWPATNMGESGQPSPYDYQSIEIWTPGETDPATVNPHKMRAPKITAKLLWRAT